MARKKSETPKKVKGSAPKKNLKIPKGQFKKLPKGTLISSSGDEVTAIAIHGKDRNVKVYKVKNSVI